MRRFIDLVETEWRAPRKPPALIYHGTSFYGAASVVECDKFLEQQDDERDHSGVSFSHRLRTAYDYSVESEYRQRNDLCWVTGQTFSQAHNSFPDAPKKGVVFVLDGASVATRHDHVVMRYGGRERPEFRVLGDCTDVSRLLVAIMFDMSDAEWWLKKYEELKQMPPLSDATAQGWREHLIEKTDALKSLMAHRRHKPLGPKPSK